MTELKIRLIAGHKVMVVDSVSFVTERLIWLYGDFKMVISIIHAIFHKTEQTILSFVPINDQSIIVIKVMGII